MARKSYSEEFRHQAVDLYETTPGATLRGIAQDLGIERGTLRQWLARDGTGRKTGADGRPAPSPLRPRRSASSRAGEGRQETASETIARLEAENAEPHSQAVKLTRGAGGILQQAAKYFAGETIW